MLGHSLLCKQLIPPTLCRAAPYRHPRQCADLVKALKDNGMLLQGAFIITLIALLQPPHRSHGSAILQNSPLLFRLSQIKIESCYLYSHKEIFSAVSVRHIWTLMHSCSLLPAENIPPNTDPHHSRFLSAGRRAKFAPPKKQTNKNQNKTTKNTNTTTTKSVLRISDLPKPWDFSSPLPSHSVSGQPNTFCWAAVSLFTSFKFSHWICKSDSYGNIFEYRFFPKGFLITQMVTLGTTNTTNFHL